MTELRIGEGVDPSASATPTKRTKEKVIELIEVDGKKVSATSTGKRKFHNKSKQGCTHCKRRRVSHGPGPTSCTTS